MAGTVVTLRPAAQPQLAPHQADALAILAANHPHRHPPAPDLEVADYLDQVGDDGFAQALCEIELALGVLIDVDEAIACGTVAALIVRIGAKHDAARQVRREGGTVYFLEGYRKAVAEAKARAEMRTAIGLALAIPADILTAAPCDPFTDRQRWAIRVASARTSLHRHATDAALYLSAAPRAAEDPDAPTPAAPPAPKPRPAPQEAEPVAARWPVNWRDVVMACAIGVALAVLSATLQSPPPPETAAQAALRMAVR